MYKIESLLSSKPLLYNLDSDAHFVLQEVSKMMTAKQMSFKDFDKI